MNPQEAIERLAKELAHHSHLTRREWYRQVYLSSDHWKKLKKQAKKHHGKKCHRCPCVRRLDVHHLNYRNIFDVTVEDLEILCRKCHQKEHGQTPVYQVVTVREKPKQKKPFKPHRNKRTGIIHTMPTGWKGKTVSKQQLRLTKLRREAARGL